MIQFLSAKFVDAQFRAFNDAFQRADRYWFTSVIGHNHLTTIGMSPFLMTTFLSNFDKVVAPQNANDIVRVTDGIALAHQTVTSMSLADPSRGMSIGSNQSSSASFALATASSSVSPAEAQPGNSGKTEE